MLIITETEGLTLAVGEAIAQNPCSTPTGCEPTIGTPTRGYDSSRRINIGFLYLSSAFDSMLTFNLSLPPNANTMKGYCISSVLIIFVLTFCSCATVLNSKTRRIDITTTEAAKIIVNHDTIPTVNNRIVFRVPRQADSLKIKIVGNRISKTAIINAENSFAYWLNAYPSPMLWTGFLIDKKNPKRYTYPGRLYLNMSDSSSPVFLFDPRDKKGQLLLDISLPWINYFYIKPSAENYKSNVGFWGIGLGLDYYYNGKQFINLKANTVMDFFIPLPAAVDIRGLNELMSSSYLAVSNNHKIKNFSLGYGVSFGRNTWDLRYFGSRSDTLTTDKQPRKKSNNAIGFVFPVYYQTGHSFYVGVIYRPTIFRMSTPTPFTYEHLISIDFGWKIRLKK